MLFTNVREDAPWANTLFSTAPWHVYPKLMEIKYFRLDMVMFDLMHIRTWDVAGMLLVHVLRSLRKPESLLVTTSRKGSNRHINP